MSKTSIGFSLLFLILVSHSWGYSEFVPLKERAQGHSLTGALQSNESIYSNPAGATFYNVYTLEGTYAFPRSFSASVVDTRTNSIGAGLGYFKVQDPNSSSVQQGLRLNLGSRISENVGVAVAGKAVWGNVLEQKGQFKDIDAGILMKNGFASAGIVLRNTFGGTDVFQQKREVSVGGRIGYENALFLSASAHSQLENLKPYEFGIGAEYISPWYFSLMGGYRFQTRNLPSYWSAGVSFLSPRMSLHYAVEFPQTPKETTSHLLGISMEM